MNSPNTRREDYPGEEPSVYEIRSDAEITPTRWHILWVNYGQNIFIDRAGSQRNERDFRIIEDFLDGKGPHSTLKELYWSIYKSRGY